MRKKIALSVSLTLILILAACGAGRMDLDNETRIGFGYGGGAAEAPQAPMAVAEAVESQLLTLPDTPAPARMLIQRASMDMETPVDDFDNTVEALQGVPDFFGGFVEQSNFSSHEVWISRDESETRRFFDITLRVPRENFDMALRHIENLAEVTHFNQSAEDVTDQYYDMAGRLATRLVEEERVLALIDEATVVENLLVLEERLGQIRTQIEIYRTRMGNMASLAALSTINISLAEQSDDEDVVVAIDGLGGRMAQAFTGSAGGTAAFLQDLLVMLAGVILPLTVVTAITLGAVFGSFRLSKIMANRKKLRAGNGE